MIRVIVDSRLRFRASEVPAALLDALCEAFTHHNPDYSQALRYRNAGMKKIELPDQFIQTWRQVEDEFSIPRGGVEKLRELFAKHALEYRFDDCRVSRPFDGDAPRLAGKIVPYAFQTEMVRQAIEIQNCVLRGPTGCGKTIFAEMLCAELNEYALVIVPCKELLKQWQERLVSELNLSPSEIGLIKGNKINIKRITLGIVNSVAKVIDELQGKFGLLIFDEVHRAAAKTFYHSVDGCDAKYRIGISADERRKDRKEFLIYDLFGEVAADIDRQTLIDQGVIYDTDIYLVPTEFDSPWYRGLSADAKMLPFNNDRLLNSMCADEERNRLIVSLVHEHMAKNEVCLVFSHRVEHGIALRDLISAEDHRVGIKNGDPEFERESEATTRGLREGVIRTAVGTYQSIGTGFDIPCASIAICTTPIHTNKQNFGQVRGRVCRVDRTPGSTKKGSSLYALWDRKIQGMAPLNNYMKWNRNVFVLERGKAIPAKQYLDRVR